ncbi:MAG: CHAT domain-containing protein, partial [Rubrivivax sp.]
YAWGVPTQDVLDAAKALRQRLDAQADGALKDCAAQMLLVVGHAKFTPDGFDVGGDGFVYLDAQDGGDGRVPLESALLPGVMTWTLDCDHGSLPSAKQAFDAFLDLLARGTTAKLTTLAASTVRRDGSAAAPLVHVRSRPSRRPSSALPAGNASEVFSSIAMNDGSAAPLPLAPLKVGVLNGNLAFVHQPLMLGHYRALELTGTEHEIDGHIGGAMGMALRAGIYPDATGSHRIFFNSRQDDENPWQLPRPRAAIIVGLGDEGALTATMLENTVAQGTKAWSQRAAEQAGGNKADIELAAVLIGSGGIGISAGGAARAIALGVRKANQRLASSGWPLVSRLTLVELFLDRAGEAWHGLRVLEAAAPQAFEISPTIASGTGALRRQPQGGYRGTDYDLINISSPGDNTIAFALDTRRARTEVRATRTQPKLVEKLVQRAATARSSDPKLGSTLFQLLVPLELQPFLSGNDRLVMQLDAGTAPIPWELLDSARSIGSDIATDSSGGSELPWAIRTRMLRKLSTGDFRNNPRDAHTDAAVLVIGEPKIDDPAYPELPGAKAEAQAVVNALRAPGGIRHDLVTALTDAPEFDTVIVALMARPYRIIHIAGHGAPIERDPTTRTIISRGGVVLSENIFLGPDEIAKLPDVPELVFVNCCHLGAADSAQTLKVTEPPAFAASVADELIKIGVRCVVAAGWAVDDIPAMKFAQRFYEVLLRGRPFVDAVVEARKAALAAAPNSKTWAAYQCYGDPNWTFCADRDDGSGPAANPGDEFEGIASALGLALMLESLAVRASFQTAATPEEAATKQQEARRRLAGFDKRYRDIWGGMGAIAEAFGVAWDAVGERDRAIDWYASALAANDASASIRAHEQFGNLRVRRAWKQAQAAVKAGARAGLDTARQDLEKALADLQGLAALQPTVERLSLCGSGLKRLAQTVQLQGGTDEAVAAALQEASEAYTSAEKKAEETEDPQLFYPGLNRMAIELVLHGAEPGWPGYAPAASARVRRSLQTRHVTAPDFWSNAGLIEFDLYVAVAAGELAGAAGRLGAAYADLHARVAAHGYWGSVSDQAQFVLGAIAAGTASTRGADVQAAQKLLDLLAAYAN